MMLINLVSQICLQVATVPLVYYLEIEYLYQKESHLSFLFMYLEDTRPLNKFVKQGLSPLAI